LRREKKGRGGGKENYRKGGGGRNSTDPASIERHVQFTSVPCEHLPKEK